MRKKIVCHECGFPVIVEHVSETVGEQIDTRKLKRDVLLSLCRRPFPLTGNEIVFIRNFFELSIAEFSEQFNACEDTIIQWEHKGDEIINLSPDMELNIRLFIIYQFDVYVDFSFGCTERNNKMISFAPVPSKEGSPSQWAIWLMWAQKAVCVLRNGDYMLSNSPSKASR